MSSDSKNCFLDDKFSELVHIYSPSTAELSSHSILDQLVPARGAFHDYSSGALYVSTLVLCKFLCLKNAL